MESECSFYESALTRTQLGLLPAPCLSLPTKMAVQSPLKSKWKTSQMSPFVMSWSPDHFPTKWHLHTPQAPKLTTTPSIGTSGFWLQARSKFSPLKAPSPSPARKRSMLERQQQPTLRIQPFQTSTSENLMRSAEDSRTCVCEKMSDQTTGCAKPPSRTAPPSLLTWSNSKFA